MQALIIIFAIPGLPLDQSHSPVTSERIDRMNLKLIIESQSATISGDVAKQSAVSNVFHPDRIRSFRLRRH